MLVGAKRRSRIIKRIFQVVVINLIVDIFGRYLTFWGIDETTILA
jgi:hypothetical protein